MPATPTRLEPVPPTRYPVMSLRELEHRPDPDWLVERFLMRQAITLLTGPSESFKTFIAIDLLMRCGIRRFTHVGPHFIDRRSVAQAPFRGLYVIGESQGAAKFRFKAWSLYHNEEYPPAVRVRPDKVNMFSEASAVMEMVEAEDPDIIVFDTWSRNAYGMNENDKKDLDKSLDVLYDVKMGGPRGGRSVVVIHHPNKAGNPTRGHTALVNDTDIHIVCNRQGDEDVKTLETRISSERQKEVDDFRPYVVTMEPQIIYGLNGEPMLRGSGEPVTSLVVGEHTKAKGPGRPEGSPRWDRYLTDFQAGALDGLSSKDIAVRYKISFKTVGRWRKAVEGLEDPTDL